MRRDHRVVDPNRPPKNFGGCSALALMTKAPRAGQVKTRLVPPLTHDEAAKLNRCFLQDTGAAISVCCTDLTSQDPGRPVARGGAVYTPVGAGMRYADVWPYDLSLLPHAGADDGDVLP